MFFSHCQNTYNTALYQRLHRKLSDLVAGPPNGQGGAAGEGGNLPDIAVGAADQVCLSFHFPFHDSQYTIQFKNFVTKLPSS